MDAKTLFDKCLAQASEVVAQVKPAQFGDPTPDTGWDVRALVGHVLYELSWVPDIVGGKTVAEVGTKYDGDLMGDDPQGAWKAAEKAAQHAVVEADLDRMIHLSYGDFTAEHYIREAATDQFIHAWDLGEGIGCPVKFDEEVAEELYRAALPHKDTLAATGLFAAAIDVPESADIQTKLLAIFGRRSSWRR